MLNGAHPPTRRLKSPRHVLPVSLSMGGRAMIGGWPGPAGRIGVASGRSAHGSSPAATRFRIVQLTRSVGFRYGFALDGRDDQGGRKRRSEHDVYVRLRKAAGPRWWPDDLPRGVGGH